MSDVAKMTAEQLLDRIMYTQPPPTVTIAERGELRAELLRRLSASQAPAAPQVDVDGPFCLKCGGSKIAFGEKYIYCRNNQCDYIVERKDVNIRQYFRITLAAAPDGLLDAVRILELFAAHNITDTDILKHTPEDHDRWHSDIVSGKLRESSPQGWVRVRDARQKEVADWCAAAFGVDHQSSVPQRGLRMLEEAIEAFQSATLGFQSAEMRDKAHALVDYVFGRVSGNLSQECGGVGLTLLALCQAAGISAEEEELREIARVKSKPLEHFRQRNQTKNDAGFDVLPAPPSAQPGEESK